MSERETRLYIRGFLFGMSVGIVFSTIVWIATEALQHG